MLIQIDPMYVGASRHTNNAGELTALLFAMCWLLDSEMQVPCVLEYDSEFAAHVVQRRYHCRFHLGLVLRARRIYDRVAHLIRWRKIDAHTGEFLNERADQLAKFATTAACLDSERVKFWARASRR